MNRVPSSILRGVALGAVAVTLAATPVVALPLGATIGVGPRISTPPRIDVTPVVGVLKPIEHAPKLLNFGVLRSYNGEQRTLKLSLTSPSDGDLTAKMSPAGPFQVTRLIGYRRFLDPTTGRWRNQTVAGNGTLSVIKGQQVGVEVTFKPTTDTDTMPRANLELYGYGWYIEVPAQGMVMHEPEIIPRPLDGAYKLVPGGEAQATIRLDRVLGANFAGPSGIDQDVTISGHSLPAGITMEPVTVRVPVGDDYVDATVKFHAGPGTPSGWDQLSTLLVEYGGEKQFIDLAAQVYPTSRTWTYDQQIGDVRHKGTLTIRSDGTWNWRAHLADDGTFFGDHFLVSLMLNVPFDPEERAVRDGQRWGHPTTYLNGSLGGGIFGGSTELTINRSEDSDPYNPPGPNEWLRRHYIEAFDHGVTIRGTATPDFGQVVAAYVEWGWKHTTGIELDLD